MEAWQERVIQEAADLQTKCVKLGEFLNNIPESVSTEQRILLAEQLGYMSLYLATLTKRIALFKKEDFNMETEENVKERFCDCGAPAQELHTCPFKEDVCGNNYEECNCCEECQHQCAMDI